MIRINKPHNQILVVILKHVIWV